MRQSTKETVLEYLRGLLQDAKERDCYSEESELRRQGEENILEEIIQELESTL